MTLKPEHLGPLADRLQCRFGVCRINDGSLAYGIDAGWFLWAPIWFKHGIVHVWNRTRCRFVGHGSIGLNIYKSKIGLGPPKCPSCMKVLKVDGRYLTQREIDEHDEEVRAYSREMSRHDPIM